MRDTWVQSLGWEGGGENELLERKTATHFSILPEKSQGQRSLVSHMGLKRVGHDLAIKITTYYIKEYFSITKIINCN